MGPAWKPIEHRQLADEVYEAVLDRILRRSIKINEQINVDEVAQQLGVSRTPVLDAIKRLSAQGLVEIKARRGTFVRGITEHDLLEIFQVREALELFSARHAIESKNHRRIVADMENLLNVMAATISEGSFENYSGFSMADRDFHWTLVNACNNQRMLKTYEDLNSHLYIMRSHLFRELDPPLRVHSDHTAILASVADRDYAAAEQAILGHLSSIKEKMLDNIRNAGGVL